MSVLRALRRALREGARAYGDEMAYTGNRRFALGRGARIALDEMEYARDVPLPNDATMMIEGALLPSRPANVSWDWDDATQGVGGDTGRTYRQVAETMNAALGEVGRRAVQQFPREYRFRGLSAGHNRLYERMARRLGPLYRYDQDQGIIPTPLAYASYAGQQAARGGGALAAYNALFGEDAQAPEAAPTGAGLLALLRQREQDA